MPDPRDSERLPTMPASLRTESQPPDAAALGAQQAASDSAIVLGLSAGQEWAADALYERVHGVVTQTLRRVLGAGDQELTDLVQEVFERLIITLSERRLEQGAKLRSWAAAVATHVGVDVLRSRVRRRRLFSAHDGWADQLPTPGPSLEVRLEARAEVERVRRVLTRMQPKQVETLILHDVLGHNLEEVAQLTQVSAAAAQSRLLRGRKELERRLQIDRSKGARA